MKRSTRNIIAPTLIAGLLTLTCFATGVDNKVQSENTPSTETKILIQTNKNQETELSPLKLSPLKDRLLSPTAEDSKKRRQRENTTRVRPNPGFVPTGHPSLPGTMW